MRRSAHLVIVAAAAAAFFTCADLGGIGHEGEARITGQLILPDGAPAIGTQVALFPSDYDPVKEARTIPFLTTDNDGYYHFSKVSPGRYTVLAIHAKRTIRILISDIRVTGAAVTIPPYSMRQAGSVKVFLPSGVNGALGYTFIPGTSLFTFLNNHTDFVVIDSVPAGMVPEIAYASTNDTVTDTIRHDVAVPPNDTVVVSNPSWKYARPLVLNTSATGANVAGTVTGFPALIRLHAGNFDFSQAHDDGADIRFTKQDTAFLDFEVERWDVAGQRAEIWVKIDSIRGNDSTQSITMYWGNPHASDNSNSAAVFDTANGFMGAWHLHEPGAAAAFDATGNHYDGTPHGMTAAFSVDGMIGNARWFNGTSSYIELTGTARSKLSFPEDGTYTLSAWVYATTIDSAAYYIISKGNRNYNLDLSGYNLWEVYDFRSGAGWERNFATPTAGEWKLLTGVRNGSDMRLYVDGRCADSTIDVYGSPLARTSDLDVQIGKRADSLYGYWNGIIDEVTIANRSRSADWIRLCYMNQNSVDRLVVFR
ncbi:MAG: DUF2341 domain-containing protein [Chitinispirillaceae bacterium]|nr:DUF2341 domain-containing protein [Chitinispirillaceae bacterium]